MGKVTWIAILAGLALLAALIMFAASSALVTVKYQISTDKVKKPIKLALVSDLHSCDYKNELVKAIAAQKPDAVLLAGDIFDDVLPHDNAKEFVRQIAGYPCYYVTGNHEIWSGEASYLKRFMRELGVTVLDGQCATLCVNEQIINICGIDDPASDSGLLADMLEKAQSAADSARFTVLLTHRPELIEEYLKYAFDLILAGHAHGGQWRLPGLINGLFAPNQGLFPKYAGGEYTFFDKAMIVSRGLARESTRVPRIFNRPELVIVEINAK